MTYPVFLLSCLIFLYTEFYFVNSHKTSTLTLFISVHYKKELLFLKNCGKYNIKK